MRRTHALGALATIVVVAGGLAVPAVAQTPTTFTFKELDKGSTFKILDVPPLQKGKKAPVFSAGDQFVFTNPLAKSASTTAGKLHVHCIVTSGGKKLTAFCQGAYAFQNGTLYASALTGLGPKTTGAITGGTGAYASARGTFESVNVKGGSNTTITLVP